MRNNLGFKLAATASLLILIVLSVDVLKAPDGSLELSAAKIKLVLATLAIIGAWILYLINHGFKARTGHDFIVDRALGRSQADSILQSYDKSKRDRQHEAAAQRNRTHLPRSYHPQGIIFGRSEDSWVFSPAVGADAPHAFVYGPTGAGKTQDVILPSIAAWPKDSHIFAIDVSGDITGTINQNPWMRTKSYRVLDFTDWAAHTRFDIFFEIRRKGEKAKQSGATDDYARAIEANEIEKIALCLLPPPRASDSSNTYFTDGGRDLLCAALLAGYFNGKGFTETLAYVVETPLNAALKAIEQSGIHQAIVKVRQFAGQSEKNLSGVRGEAVKAAERITKNAIASRVLTPPKVGESVTLLSPRDIEQHDIFIKLRMTDVSVLSSVLGLITAQIMDYFYTRDLAYAASHPILVVADELASYCRYWSSIDNDIRNLRKFGIRMLMCSQDFTSIDTQIGKAKRETIIANTGYKIILGSYVAADQRELADLIGKEEQLKRIQSYSPYTRTSYTDRWEHQYAIAPEDFGTLSATHQLVVISPQGWERISTAPFWKLKEQMHTTVSSTFSWQNF